MKPAAYAYILSCADQSLYTGWTTNLDARLLSHSRGRAAKYTRTRLPVMLVAWCVFDGPAPARSFEARFKLLSRAQKLHALDQRQAFGVPLRNAPLLPTDSGGSMAARTEPVGEELRTLVERAKTSAARITTNRGDIVFSFFPDDAPQHCAAFIKLSEDGFYDGLKFHRVEPGFVVQGGDPDGNGTGGPGYRLKAEFNKKPHLRGTVAMARSQNPDSAGSQFYICLDDARFLDNQYTVFGQMSAGFDALDKIRVGDTMQSVTIEPKS